MVSFEDVEKNDKVKIHIAMADKVLKAIGYTEHSFGHMKVCSQTTEYILKSLGYPQRTLELAKIAAYLHDIGNAVNRNNHAETGAMLAYSLLNDMDMDYTEIMTIISAIGHHDDHTAFPVDEIAAALILADKSDVRRSRARNTDVEKYGIHWRVNYAVEKSTLKIDAENKNIILELKIDNEISSVSEYFQIFLERMNLCKRAAKYFGYTFELNMNDYRMM